MEAINIMFSKEMKKFLKIWVAFVLCLTAISCTMLESSTSSVPSLKSNTPSLNEEELLFAKLSKGFISELGEIEGFSMSDLDKYLALYSSDGVKKEFYNESHYSSILMLSKAILDKEKKYEQYKSDLNGYADALSTTKTIEENEQTFALFTNLYQETKSAYSKDYFADLNLAVNKQMEKIRNPWTSTERYKILLKEVTESVDLEDLEKPIYTSSKDLKLTLKSILETDWREIENDFFSIDIYMYKNELGLITVEIYYSIEAFNNPTEIADYKFVMHSNKSKLIIDYVYSESANIFSSSVSDIETALKDALMSASSAKEQIDLIKMLYLFAIMS